MWVKLDDNYHDNEKILSVSFAARWIHAAAMSWSGKHLTDGLIPKSVAWRLGSEDETCLPGVWIQELVQARLFEEVEAGYRIHDFSDYNPTAEEVSNGDFSKMEVRRKGGQKRAAKASRDGSGRFRKRTEDSSVQLGSQQDQLPAGPNNQLGASSQLDPAGPERTPQKLDSGVDPVCLSPQNSSSTSCQLAQLDSSRTSPVPVPVLNTSPSETLRSPVYACDPATRGDPAARPSSSDPPLALPVARSVGVSELGRLAQPLPRTVVVADRMGRPIDRSGGSPGTLSAARGSPRSPARGEGRGAEDRAAVRVPGDSGTLAVQGELGLMGLYRSLPSSSSSRGLERNSIRAKTSQNGQKSWWIDPNDPRVRTARALNRAQHARIWDTEQKPNTPPDGTPELRRRIGTA